MFTTDDLAQCFCCVLLAIRCAFGVHLDVDASDQPTTHEVPVVLFPNIGKKGVFDKEQSLSQNEFLRYYQCAFALLLHDTGLFSHKTGLFPHKQNN